MAEARKIREKLRARLTSGALPHELDTSVRPEQIPEAAMIVGRALPDRCGVCDEPGTQLRFSSTGRTFAFHGPCHKLWQEEAPRPIAHRGT
jgi:hypothetical protein